MEWLRIPSTIRSVTLGSGTDAKHRRTRAGCHREGPLEADEESAAEAEAKEEASEAEKELSMAKNPKKHQFNDCPPVQPKHEVGFAEVYAPVNICPTESKHINTLDNSRVIQDVQKIMRPAEGQSTSDGPNLYDSMTSGRKR
jgi:hypothetical protein